MADEPQTYEWTYYGFEYISGQWRCVIRKSPPLRVDRANKDDAVLYRVSVDGSLHETGENPWSHTHR